MVADRLDITGARRGDFDDYWTYHLAQERRRIHQSRYADALIPQTGSTVTPKEPHAI